MIETLPPFSFQLNEFLIPQLLPARLQGER